MNARDRACNAHGFNRQRYQGLIGEDHHLFVDDQQWQETLATDPDYATWSEKHHAADAMQFDDWLETPAGSAWLNAEEDRYITAADHGYAWERQA
jgi:hypothetical protein